MVFPFYTIHCLSLGLTLTESGLVFGLIPIFGCFGSPLAGFLADKLGDSKKVLISFILITITSNTLLGFANPIYSRKITTTKHHLDNASYQISHTADNEGIFVDIYVQVGAPNRDKTCEIEIQDDWNSTRNENLCQDECQAWNYSGGINQEGFRMRRNFISEVPAKIQFGWNRLNFRFFIKDNNVFSQHNYTENPIRNCVIKCKLQEKNVSFTCKDEAIIGNRVVTFTCYAALRVIGAVAAACAMSLITVATVQIVHREKADYGFHQLFTVAGGLSPPLGGYLYGLATAASGKQNFAPIFIVFGIMWTLGAILCWFMDFNLKPPEKQIWWNIWQLLKNVKVASYVFVMFLIGCFYGILEKYVRNWFQWKQLIELYSQLMTDLIA